MHCLIRYFYTLDYSEDSFPFGIVRKDARNDECVNDVNSLGSVVNLDQYNPVARNVARDGIATTESPVIEKEGNQNVPIDSSKANTDRGVDLSKVNPDLMLCHLNQDLHVYAIADKYSILSLKKKARQHFVQALGHMKLTIAVFDIVRDVNSLIPPHDRDLRDIVIARVYRELQYWIKQDEFMTALRHENEFCAELLAFTVKEDLASYETALTTIEHPGYCEKCRATLTTKRSVSRRNSVRIDKHCAQCDPWH